MKAPLKRLAKACLERALRSSGYRLVHPGQRYGIDYITDIRRLSNAYQKNVDVIFDVGANVGTSSRAFRAVWPTAGIYAFEPSPSMAETLQANLKADPSISIERMALGRESGRSSFYTYDDAPDLNSLHGKSPYIERFGKEGRLSEIDVTTLDAFCQSRGIEHIGVLKIDTEGSDHDVLLGAQGYLRDRRIDFVYCEFNSLGDGPQLGSLLPIARLLGENDYNFIASYSDYIVTEGRFFSVSNALFAAA